MSKTLIEIQNTRKNELIEMQSTLLKKSLTNKVKLTDSEETQYKNADAELAEINGTLDRLKKIDQGRSEIGQISQSLALPGDNTSKFVAFGGRTPMNVDADYVKKFWQSLRSSGSFTSFQNASLGETGSTAAGGALVPIETDPSIPNLQIEECSARGLSRVITTEMDINVPYQASKTTAALKTESTSSGTNAFATNAPTFATTKLSAFMLGDSVYASWELLQDAKAASAFITADLARAVRAKEENYFISGSGTSQPQGYLTNATTAVGTDVTAGAATLAANPLLDTMSTLNHAYYSKASWLVNRQEFNRLLKKQIASSQYQTYVTWDADGNARLFGYPVAFSAEMGVYVASPATNGNWLFGDFASFAVIGDRGDSNIKIQVLDQVAALNGQTVILGYRRVDQRIVLQEAVVQFNTTG